MPRIVRDVMATDICEAGLDQTVTDVARMMRDEGVGDVLVTDSGSLRGIVTDRDIVVRAIAEGLDPQRETVDAVFSGQDLATITPDTSLEDAARTMREKAVRRLPVIENDRAVGILSIGDLAIERDENSVLADISVAPENE